MENIPLLCQKYFRDNKKVNKFIPPEIYRWVEKIITDEYAKMKKGSSKKIVMVKILHTKYVLEAGLEILKGTQEINWNYCQAITICLLHDIGRFKQAIHSTYDDVLSGIDHATLGANMFLNKGFEIDKKHHCNEKEITEAIDRHSRKDYCGDNQYAKLIRDADKIGLLRQFERLEAWSREEFKGNEISQMVFKEFTTKRNVTTANRKTLADQYLLLASWFFDLNFEISRKIVIDEKIPEKILAGLKNLEVDKDKYDKVKEILDNFKYMNNKKVHIVSAIIKNERDEYLLVQQLARNYGKYQDSWYPPGGHVEKGETVEECLKRELKEELNLEIEPIKEIAITSGDIKNFIVHWWFCEIKSGNIVVDKTLKKAGFFSNEEIIKMDLWPATRKFFEEFIWKK